MYIVQMIIIIEVVSIYIKSYNYHLSFVVRIFKIYSHSFHIDHLVVNTKLTVGSVKVLHVGLTLY